MIPSTMASHHHHHHHQQCHPTTTTTATATVCCCCYSCPNNTPPHYPPLSDHHLLHHHHHPQPQTNSYFPHPNGPFPNPPYTNQYLHCDHHQPPQYHQPPTGFEKERHFQQLHHHEQGGLTHTHPIVSSLLLRISALESSLRHHSSSYSHSLRDAAARTIQTHFRAFLVRRSRTLRQLKDLAAIKSTLNLLRSSVSESTHFDPQSLSRKALKLLLKLDSIQGGDVMIRDGKKSVSRELNRFVDLIDADILKRSEVSARLVKMNNPTRKSDNRRGIVGTRDLGKTKRLEDLVDRIDALYTKVAEEDHEFPATSRIERNSVSRNQTGYDGVDAKVKKSVSFVENGKVYKVHRSRFEPVSSRDFENDDESDPIGARGQSKAEEIGVISLIKDEDDEEDRSQDGKSTKSSDGEGSPLY